MQRYSPASIKNVALVSHGGAGKTSLTEAMLFAAKAVDRFGRVDEGTATTDYEPEEIKRRISASLAIAPFSWKNYKFNIVDTPGYFDFVGEVKAGLRAVDSAILVVDGVAGVEVGTELVWKYVQERDLPCLVFVNKLDRENSSFEKTLGQLKDALNANFVPMQWPIGQEANFRGVVDVVKGQAFDYSSKGKGPVEDKIPDEIAEQVAALRESIIEAAAEGDDELLMKYLDGGTLDQEEIIRGLRSTVRGKKVVPVFCGSAIKSIGVEMLLDWASELLPSPSELAAVSGENPRTGQRQERPAKEDAPFSALVFKTTADPYVGKLTLFRVFSGTLRSDSHVYNSSRGRSERVGQLFLMRGKQQEPLGEAVAGDIAAVAKLQETSTGDTLCEESAPIVLEPISFPEPVYPVAVQPKSKGDEEKISAGLARLSDEDPTIKLEKNTETGETVVYGMGELHLEVTMERLKRKFGVEVTLRVPKVPYRETIRSSVKAEGKYKRQTGGRGQYGHVWLEVEPLPDGDYEFVDKIFGGVVPQQYRPAVDKGVREAMQEGVLASYPMTGVRVTLYDGSYHPVDSSELAFKIAASMAFKKAVSEANPVLLEPIVNVEVMVPEAFMGDVMGDLNKKRGRILGIERVGASQIVKAQVPLAEMFRYAVDLRSITQGRGSYKMTFSHYEEVPFNVAQQVIEQAKKAAEAEK